MRCLMRIAPLLATAVLLAACGGRLVGKKQDEPEATPVNLARPDTPENRAVQVGWTAASATFCGFNVPRDKLKADYLAFERKQGAPPETLSQLSQSYDVTYTTFFAKVQKQPNYCDKKRVEAIRADINRHLRGDYTPSDHNPPPPET